MAETRTPLDSPALKYRSPHYPRRGFEEQEDRVPRRVLITKNVRGELPYGPRLYCASGDEYECYVNSHGAVAAITPNGLLGLKPGEFTVLTYHDAPTEPANAPQTHPVPSAG